MEWKNLPGFGTYSFEVTSFNSYLCLSGLFRGYGSFEKPDETWSKLDTIILTIVFKYHTKLGEEIFIHELEYIGAKSI